MAIYGRAPFTYNDDMLELSKKLRGSSRHSTAKNVFDWMAENIRYNNYAKGILRSLFLNYDYKSAHEVFRAGEGICLDQAYLYCVLARYTGVNSSVVEVKKDCNGEKVWHACCCVDGKLLVDTAYSRFDVEHEDYRIMSDDEVRKEYYSIKHCYEDNEIIERAVVCDKPAPYIPLVFKIPDYVEPVFKIPDNVNIKPVFDAHSIANTPDCSFSGRNMPAIKIDVNIMRIEINSPLKVDRGFSKPLNLESAVNTGALKDNTEINCFYFERKKDYNRLNSFLKSYLEEKD